MEGVFFMSVKAGHFFKLSFLIAFFLMFSSSSEENVFHDTSGMTGKYRIDRPAPGTKLGVLVYFHGSGSTASYAANFSDLSKIAASFDLAPVALQAPDGAITWAEKGPSSGRIPYAQALLKTEVFGKSPNLDINKTIFVGVSAGATFIAGDFLPSHIKDYRGGAVLLCGGASPIYPIKIATTKKDFKMYAVIHPTDFLFGQTIAGVDFWRNRGLLVKTIQPMVAGHCGFDLNAALREGIGFVLGK
jgi:hypothetical protein